MNVAYNMDCLEAMRQMPDNAFDLAVVDPPYGSGEAANTHTGGVEPLWGTVSQVHCERTGGTWAAKYGKKIIAWDVAPGKEYFDELFRVSRNQIIWGGNYFDLPPTRCFLVWRKTNIPLEGFTMAPVEYAWTSFRQNAGCVECGSQRGNDAGGFHPTEKPVSLYRWIFTHYANPGEKILDTHLGSGSSRIGAYDAGLDFVGYEIDKTYFELQEQRFDRHTAQQNLFLMAGSDQNQLNLYGD